MQKILVLHGPNLNMLGTREPEHYGNINLEQINKTLADQADHLGYELTTAQSNAEHELIEWIQNAKQKKIAFILFNPAAFTHTSIALHDALLATGVPFIEIHLSNIYAREKFRHHSYFSAIAVGTIAGFGINSYLLGLQAADYFLKTKK